MVPTYGRYKQIRNGAWHALIDNHISTIPVDLIQVLNQNGILIYKNSEVNILNQGELGASIFDGEHWIIVYDDTIQSIGNKRFTIAHELGHIFLGHPLVDGYHARTFGNTGGDKNEKEANMFAIRFLAPACALWGLDLHTHEEIAQACRLSDDAAKHRAKRMEVLYQRNDFLRDPLERELFEQFKPFIDKCKK